MSALTAAAKARAHGYKPGTGPPDAWCNAALFGALAAQLDRLDAIVRGVAQRGQLHDCGIPACDNQLCAAARYAAEKEIP